MNLLLSFAFIILMGVFFTTLLILLGLGLVVAWIVNVVEESRQERIDDERRETNARRKKDSIEYLKIIQPKYEAFMDAMVNSYELKVCPKCFEGTMELTSLSPTGQSSEYKCLHCSKVINSRILPDKDGTELVNQLYTIKSLLSRVSLDLVRNELVKFGNPTFLFVISNKIPLKSSTRAPIPESVRHEVWQRDGGKCVECGSQKKLEYDHIIPVSKGGSNTARNIQLLCEVCNRKKSGKI